MKFKKPKVKQILTHKPRERYLLDLQIINNNLQDKFHKYKFFFNIIDHYSKLTGSYLLENKEAQTVLNCLNNFISIYGPPDAIQSDNGLEFSNKLITNYCKHNNINIIHSSVRHPSTNGGVERIHREICKSMYAEKLKNKEKYNMEFSLSNAVKAQNNVISRVTKYKPNELFFNNDDTKTIKVNDNMIKSQKNVNNKIKPIQKYSKILICNTFNQNGNNIKPNFGKKEIYIIPGTIIGEGNATSYKVCVDKSYNDLKKNEVYSIDYKLVKEVTTFVYNKYLLNDDIELNNKINSKQNINSDNSNKINSSIFENSNNLKNSDSDEVNDSLSFDDNIGYDKNNNISKNNLFNNINDSNLDSFNNEANIDLDSNNINEN